MAMESTVVAPAAVLVPLLAYSSVIAAGVAAAHVGTAEAPPEVSR
jgi:hypothetical protein